MSKRLLVPLIVLAMGLFACGDKDPATPAGESGSRVLTGVVVAIDGQGMEEVTSFTLRVDGTNHEIWIDPNREYGFALGHLHAHLQGAEPVTVIYEQGDGQMTAISIEDA